MAKQRRKRKIKRKGIGAYDKGTKNPSYAYEDNPNIGEFEKDVLDKYQAGDIVADYTGLANPSGKQKRIAFKQMKAEGFTSDSIKKLKKAHKNYRKTAKNLGETFATGEVLRASQEAEDERNKAIDEKSGQKISPKKALKREKKVDRLAEKQDKARRKHIGIIEPLEARKSYRRRQEKKAKKPKDPYDNPAQRFLSKTIDNVLDNNTGSSSMNEAPEGEVNSPVPSTSSVTADDIRGKIKFITNDENKKIVNASIDKVLDIINNDPNLKNMSTEDMIDYATDFVNKNTKTATKIINEDVSGNTTSTGTGTETSTVTGTGIGTGQTVSKVMNKQDGKVEKPTLNTDSNLREIEKNLAASAGGAVDKLDLRDYYPEAGKNIAVGTFTGSRIGSQTIYSGAGMVLPMGMMDARSAAMQKAAQAKITALNDIKDSLGEASYQFNQSFQDKGMNMINSYIQKHGSNPSAILSDIEFRKDIKKYNAFAESSKKITELVKQAQLKSQPDDKGQVAAHYTPGQLKEMSDFLDGAKDPDYMNDVISGKINIGKILTSIDGKVKLTDLVDEKFKTLINSKLERERPFNFTLKQGLTEEEFGEAKDFIEQVKTGKRETSNLYRSGVLKYFDWASEENVTTMITEMAKRNNINLNDKYGKDYVSETIDYLMAQMPSESFVQNFEKIGNMTLTDANNYTKRKIAEWNNQTKIRVAEGTSVANNHLNTVFKTNKNSKKTTYTRTSYPGNTVTNANQSDFGLWGVINGEKASDKQFITLEEFRNGVTENGTEIKSFKNYKEGTGKTHNVDVKRLQNIISTHDEIDFASGGSTISYSGGASKNPRSYMWAYGNATVANTNADGDIVSVVNLDENAEFISRPALSSKGSERYKSTQNNVDAILTGNYKNTPNKALTRDTD